MEYIRHGPHDITAPLWIEREDRDELWAGLPTIAPPWELPVRLPDTTDRQFEKHTRFLFPSLVVGLPQFSDPTICSNFNINIISTFNIFTSRHSFHHSVLACVPSFRTIKRTNRQQITERDIKTKDKWQKQHDTKMVETLASQLPFSPKEI